MSTRLTRPGDKRVARGQANRESRLVAADLLSKYICIRVSSPLSAQETKSFRKLIKALETGKAIGPLHARAVKS